MLVDVARTVRDAVRSHVDDRDAQVERHAGGDDVYGVDARADAALLGGLAAAAARQELGLSGTLVCEGFDEPLAVGDGTGAWRIIADPVDGTRGYLAEKRSAWVLLGAGRGAATLEELEVGVAVEIPGPDAARGVVAWATRGSGAHAVLEAVADPRRAATKPRTAALVDPIGTDALPLALRPRPDGDLDRAFVTVVRLLPGGHERIGRFADAVLEGLEVYDDLAPCTGGQLLGLARGSEAAVIDPRPHFAHPFCAHPYDLAALVIAREAGVVVEALDGGPLAVPLDTATDVGWVGYANPAIAARLRPRIVAALG